MGDNKGRIIFLEHYLMDQSDESHPITTDELDEYFSMPPLFVGGRKGHFFTLTVSGESMVDAGIDDGDIVICRERGEAQVDDIVVAYIRGSGSTLKRFCRDDSFFLPAYSYMTVTLLYSGLADEKALLYNESWVSRFICGPVSLKTGGRFFTRMYDRKLAENGMPLYSPEPRGLRLSRVIYAKAGQRQCLAKSLTAKLWQKSKLFCRENAVLDRYVKVFTIGCTQD